MTRRSDIGAAGAGLDAALNALPDGLIVLDQAGVVRFCNREAGTIAGLAPAAVIGERFAQIQDCSALNWVSVLELIEAGRSGNLMLRGEAVGAIFVIVRRMTEPGGAPAPAMRSPCAIWRCSTTPAVRPVASARRWRFRAPPSVACAPTSPASAISRPGLTR
ncbi:MAG: PAS domain-containing protein [Paracoccaceae bacterium]|nr:PAS domain-containing protein [Paracoccaceae bacterium]